MAYRFLYNIYITRLTVYLSFAFLAKNTTVSGYFLYNLNIWNELYQIQDFSKH